MRDVRGEAMGRLVDWSQRQEPRRNLPGDGPALTEEELFQAYSVGTRRGARAPFPVDRRMHHEDEA